MSFALFIQAGNYGLPGIGPKEADKNVRQFTDEQMKAGQGKNCQTQNH